MAIRKGFERCLGYVLHRRKLLEKTQLVELFVLEHGRVTALLKASMEPTRKRKVAVAARLQPFQTFVLNVKLKTSGLSVLGGYDEVPPARHLSGHALYAGLYLNELIMRLLPLGEAAHSLFEVYTQSLDGLTQTDELEPVLRCFEKLLLEVIGYGINWHRETSQNAKIAAGKHYYFSASEGFCLASNPAAKTFSGDDIIAISEGSFHSAQIRHSAKHIMRAALAPHLGDKPLYSRTLFL